MPYGGCGHADDGQHRKHNAGASQNIPHVACLNGYWIGYVGRVLLYGLADTCSLPVHSFLKKTTSDAMRD